MASSSEQSNSFEEQRQRRLQRRRERERARRASETAQQREERLGRRRVGSIMASSSEQLESNSSEEQRQRRLQRRRERERARRASETAQQREERLGRRRVRDRARRAAQTVQQRQASQQRRSNRQNAESAQEREDRLLQLRVNQRQRLAAESLEERERRLQERDTQTTQCTGEQFRQSSVQLKMKRFHECFTSLSPQKCFTCSECFPGLQLRTSTTECMRCSRDKHIPKVYSSANNMDPGQLPSQLQVSTCVHVIMWHSNNYTITFVQGLTQVEEMLISAVLPIMSLYKLPHGQYGYSGHVINLPQDIASFANSLPRLPSELDVIIVRKEGAVNSHRDFRVRRAIVLRALQWLVTNNKYYRHVSINPNALVMLPDDGELNCLHCVSLDSSEEDAGSPVMQDESEDPYDTHLSGSFVLNPAWINLLCDAGVADHILHKHTTLSLIIQPYF